MTKPLSQPAMSEDAQRPIPITPDSPPKLPCYVWSPHNKTWMHISGGLKLDYGTVFTHWLPDQPTAPTTVPNQQT